MYSSENKGADQLLCNRAANLHLCLCIGYKGFLTTLLILYSTVKETFISFTLTNVEFRKSRDFFAWILRGFCVELARK